MTLSAAPILGGYDMTFGATRLHERVDLAMVSVAVPLGGEAHLAKALKTAFRLDMPDQRSSRLAGKTRALRTAPDQLMLIFPHDGPDAAAMVAGKLKGSGYVTDQTDVWVALELDGPETRAALERLCPLDLEPSAFAEGAFARTVMEHMGALILRAGPDRFLLFSASSSARSFLHAVETSFHNILPG